MPQNSRTGDQPDTGVGIDVADLVWMLQGGGALGLNIPSGADSCGSAIHHAPPPSSLLRSSPRQAAWAKCSRPGSGGRGRDCDRSPVRQRGHNCTPSGRRCGRHLPHLRCSAPVDSQSYCITQISQACTLQALRSVPVLPSGDQ